jgi:hypothetical protein
MAMNLWMFVHPLCLAGLTGLLATGVIACRHAPERHLREPLALPSETYGRSRGAI